MTAPLDLPQSVLDLVEFHPSEDILLAILREGLPDVPSLSLIADDPKLPFILARRQPGSFLEGEGDPRFVDVSRFVIETFTEDPDGDEKGALLAEACRVVLRNAWLQSKNYPGLGSIVKIECLVKPARQSDWATSSGPVQYADLPTGYWRYEAQYSLVVRKPRS